MGNNETKGDTITFTFNNQQYTKKLKQGDHYLVYMKVSKDTPNYFDVTEVILK
jgi:hypothetical protein